MKLLSFFLFATSACLSLAATPAQWKTKSIYFIMTDRFARTDGSTTAPCDVGQKKYCGGSWQGIINKLDYIKNMGFTAIWITPITHNIEQSTSAGEAFHGYWQDDIYAVNEHYGTENDLKALAKAVHAKGMYLMVDVVANHYAYAGGPNDVQYAAYRPFNDSSYFHKPCNIDNYDNQSQVEQCWLGYNTAVELTDVDTTQPRVKTLYQSWIKDLVQKYSIDGLRVDTVKHVQKDFWPGFNQASGVYNVGEVFSGDPTYLCDYQNYMDGLLNYALFYPLTRAFQSTTGSISDLANSINTVKSTCKDSTLLGSFLENHDQPRFPSLTKDLSLAKNAITFMLLADGIPILYYGQEYQFAGGNDPYDREPLWPTAYKTDEKSAPLYGLIAKVNQIRNVAIARDPKYVDYKAYPIYTDANTIAMRKGFDGGQIVGVFSNKGAGGNSYNLVLGNNGFAAGSEVVEILTCQKQKVDSKGQVTVAMSQGLPRVFYPTAKLSGSGVCGM